MTTTYPSGQTGNATGSTGTITGDTGDILRTSTQDTYSEAKTGAKRTGEALRTELSSLKSDLDTLLSRATSLSDTELNQEYARLMAKFSSLRYAAKGVAAEANRQFSRGVDVTSDYVKDKPLQSVAVATGVGLLLGLLFKRS